MNLKCISCEALARLAYLSAAYSPHVVDVELFKIGLHRNPDDLRTRLQAKIDAMSGQGYDAIVMAYGLCGKATNGLTARDIPIVIPRAHDCITLFLGSRARYKDESVSNPGTYWYVLDYVQRNANTGTTLSLGAEMDGGMDAYVRGIRRKVRQGQRRLPDGSDGRVARALQPRRLHRYGRGRQQRSSRRRRKQKPTVAAGPSSV